MSDSVLVLPPVKECWTCGNFETCMKNEGCGGSDWTANLNTDVVHSVPDRGNLSTRTHGREASHG